jgi:hypothetical protein
VLVGCYPRQSMPVGNPRIIILSGMKFSISQSLLIADLVQLHE